MSLKGSQTQKNLARAFSVETQDGAHYQFIRQMATEQKQNFVANTLKTLATNEMSHAKIWYDYLVSASSGESVDIKYSYIYRGGNLVESLEHLLDVEKKEGEKLYVEFGKIARNEGFNDIAAAFDMVAKVELQHAMILEQLYTGLKDGGIYKQENCGAWKCGKCGFEAQSKNGAWKSCPLCKQPQGFAIPEIEMSMFPKPAGNADVTKNNAAKAGTGTAGGNADTANGKTGGTASKKANSSATSKSSSSTTSKPTNATSGKKAGTTAKKTAAKKQTVGDKLSAVIDTANEKIAAMGKRMTTGTSKSTAKKPANKKTVTVPGAKKTPMAAKPKN